MPSTVRKPGKIDAGGFPGFDLEDDPPWEQDTGDDYFKWKHYQPTKLGGTLEVRGRIVVSYKAHQQHKKQLPYYYNPQTEIHPSRPPTDKKKLLHEGNRRNPVTPQGFDVAHRAPSKQLKDYESEYQYNPANRNRVRTPDRSVHKKSPFTSATIRGVKKV